jgi:hypothetical protein
MAVLDRPVAPALQVPIGPTVTATATAAGQVVYPSFDFDSKTLSNGGGYYAELKARFLARKAVPEPTGDDYEPESEVLAADPF